MKRIVLSGLAFSMLAATSLTGQAAPLNAPVAPQSNYTNVDWQKPTNRDVRKRVIQKRVIQKRIIQKKVVVKRNNWRNGQKYSGWRQHQPVRDYGRYGLHRPGRGQEWIRVGNDYVLVGALSGIIFGAIAAQ
ncbi:MULTISPECIES: RcnB family protein [unclassified Mesorhizobium]|uniref:RcnB family protein n=1 Tax=unclassified Mesorhizobium TaxID=325217 RepID=UPI00112DCFA0|nr:MULTISPECIES: RcnB family protein [unclassified Mesorhizobium]TPJ48236.1 RcnB family protein [Mesorhizobium sp. B2-6-6]MBZ9894164.1 RcnB family protein [Mesorhizobium sp. BR1-1-6]MBZ9920399.1 RcnB family protein [Mesorhizobium sp. BR1-1-7]MBZ9972340.1 RcnB family protein [Mesorhizobium sp. BR1-1-12]MBZ9983623.1 RcnB family protein [Mesorhizobium sp. BR-1-1-8]